MKQKLDNILNSITVYKLVAWGLSLLALMSLVFAMTGAIGYSVGSLLISLTIVMTVGYVANQLMAHIWKVPTNSESGLITALILFFIVPPVESWLTTVQLVLALCVAIASKFILAINGKHIFNPAAIGVVIVSLLGLRHASWWVGNSTMWPFVLILGLLIVYKIRKLYLTGIFIAVSIVVALTVGANNGASINDTLNLLITSSPLLFLGTIMLTEPSTMPSQKKHQVLFASLVAILYAGQFKIPGTYVYPEFALVAGNIYAFFVSSKRNWTLRLVEKRKVSGQVYDYVFEPSAPMQFIPGQYMDWTLGHTKADVRGNRRTFTIASSPTESNVHLGVKFYKPSSSYKKALGDMKPGDTLVAGHIAGNFILPSDISKKLLFVAGGIGVTPFRSMVQDMIDTKTHRDVILLYAVSDKSEIAFSEIFQTAQQYGVELKPVIGVTLSEDLIKRTVHDLTQRLIYVSGPNKMVDATTALLREAHVPRRQIKTDHFSGY